MDDDDRMLALLVAVRDGDDAGEPMSNRLLAERLGWSAVDVAQSLATARESMLIWGFHSSGDPRPQFDGLELTVQGRRLLDSQPARRPPAGGARAGSRQRR